MPGKKRGAGEGSIYRRNDGRWVAVVTLRSGGQRKRTAFYGQSRREVADRMAAALPDLQNGSAPTDPRMTLTAFLTIWINSVRDGVRPATFVSYRGRSSRPTWSQ